MMHFCYYNGSNSLFVDTDSDYIMLAIGAVIMIAGLSFFQIGAQNSLIKVGEYMGSSLSKQKKEVQKKSFLF